MRSVRAELFHADRRTDRHDKANSRFSQFYEKRLTTQFIVKNIIGGRNQLGKTALCVTDCIIKGT
jgi:hypothetical protein